MHDLNRANYDGRVYRATVRHFGKSVEMSVRCVGSDEMNQHLQGPAIPPSLLPLKAISSEERERRDEENRQRAIRRACQSVRWLLKTMGADHLLTLTYRENVQDLDRVQRDFQRFIRLVRVRYPAWRYVCVRERQGRGAWHLHIGICGWGDVHWLRRCWLMVLGHRVRFEYSQEGKRKLVAMVKDGKAWRDALPEEVMGNIHVRGPSKRWGGDGHKWQTEKLAAYMTKYMHKAFDELESGRRYWPAKGIRPPEPVKFWLASASFDEAVREAHDMMRQRFSCSRLVILSSDDMTRLWFSGSEIECPF